MRYHCDVGASLKGIRPIYEYMRNWLQSHQLRFDFIQVFIGRCVCVCVCMCIVVSTLLAAFPSNLAKFSKGDQFIDDIMRT